MERGRPDTCQLTDFYHGKNPSFLFAASGRFYPVKKHRKIPLFFHRKQGDLLEKHHCFG